MAIGKQARWRGGPRRALARAGLSLARAVARAHGGDIRVAPTPGGGATFVIELPVCLNPPS